MKDIDKQKILLVGNPNIGKSALFQALSGQFVEISNYPGTTVEILKARLNDKTDLIDTPGIYSISAENDEEKIAFESLKELAESDKNNDFVINIVNACSLQKDLFLTLHLIDCKIPLILVINQIDQLEKQKEKINYEKLAKKLNVKVFPVSALTGQGIQDLKDFITSVAEVKANGFQSFELMGELDKLEIKNNTFEKIMLLEGQIKSAEKLNFKTKKSDIYAKRRERVNRLFDGLLEREFSEEHNKFTKKLDEVLIHPLYGTLIGLGLGFFFLYQVLGVWVAGDLVDFLENKVFDKYWNSGVRWTVAQVLPVDIRITEGNRESYNKWQKVLPTDCGEDQECLNVRGIGAGMTFENGLLHQDYSREVLQKNFSSNELEYIFSPADLIDKPNGRTSLEQNFWSSLGTILAGKYGILTLTVTYLLGVLLPLIWFFYLSWALFEDSGYLPRMAVLADGFLRIIGLNGRGIIPLVLGLGCVTMAVVTTRLMSNKREQLILMILLGIAVPCSAQLGIIQGLLAKTGGLMGWLIWLSVLLMVLFLCGFLANKIIKGKPTPLLLELPPLRIPCWKNVLNKANQKSWFFLQESSLPFVLASLVITVFQVTGILTLIIEWLKPAVSGILHLPKEVALSFLLGMVRRDFGAFGLLDINLNQIQVITASVTLTLFVPCIATLGVMVKERNWQTAFGIWLSSWVFGFTIGGLLTRVLEFFI